MPDVSTPPTVENPVAPPPLRRPTPAPEVEPAAPEPARCLECEAVLSGRYCSQCGQKVLGGDALSARAAFQDVFNKFLRVDGRFFQALRLLLFAPGLLTADFVAGRRQRHLAPTKLYFLVNCFFFMLVQKYDPITADIAAEMVGPQAWKAAQLRVGMSAGAFGSAVENGIAGLFPTWLFLLVAANAAVLALLYFRNRQPFGVHAAFAFHFLAFALIAFTPGTVMGIPNGETVTNVALLLVIPVWLAFALRRVYGQGWGVTLLKTAALWLAFVLSIYLYSVGVTAWAMARV